MGNIINMKEQRKLINQDIQIGVGKEGSIMITNKVIKSLNPCKDRYDNYLKYYGDKELTIRQFMGRKHITQSDKLWVAFRLMPKDNIRLAAADIAESVLHIYENAYPNDDRPRKAIEAARKGDVDAAVNAADRAANAADAAYADANAYAAAYAAVNVATYAAYAAVNAADRAANAAARAASDRNTQEKLIRKIIMGYWK
jgi:hypothetical protein